MPKTKNRTFRRMVESIEAMVIGGEYPPGTKIPPVRELSREYGISIGTATRGISYLVENQLLETRRGAGTFVRPPATEAKQQESGREIRIAIFAVNSNPAEYYCAHALRGVQDASQQTNCLLQTRFRLHDNLSAKELTEVASDNDVLLFLSDYDRFLTAIPRNRPSVSVEMHSSFGQINSTVTLDPVDAAEQATEFFLAKGAKEVRVFSHDGPIHRTRAALFAARWAKHGRCRVEETNPSDIWDIDCSDPDPGYLFTSGSTADGHAKRYRERTGRYFCAERKVLALDGKSLIIPNYEPIDCIGIDWYEAGMVAFEECLRRLRNPGSLARRIYLAGKFHSFREMLPPDNV